MAVRKYVKKQRAASQEATRARIVAALMELHGEVGPKATTISAVAERAGVQRLTVYRHFPDEASMFKACTTRWMELNPPPDPAVWAAEADGAARCRRALGLYYAYYAATRGMWSGAFRDERDIPALKEAMDDFRASLDAVRDDLLAGFGEDDPASPLGVTLGHALTFATWRSLAGEGLDPDAAADLATTWAEAARDA